MNKILNSDSVLVLDTVHGGDFLSTKLEELGIDSKAINPYDGEEENPRKYDKIVSPIHLDPSYPVIRESDEEKIITHHELVKDLICYHGFLDDIYCIEVTGTFGKTSTSLLLGDMLGQDGNDFVIHSSNGLSFNRESIDSFSISPAGNLKAVEHFVEDGIEPDFLINEVSLGFLGISDLAIIPSLKNDYLIAGDSYRASRKKIETVSDLKDDCDLISPNKISGRDVIDFKNDFDYRVRGNTLEIEGNGVIDEENIFSIDPVLFKFFESSLLSSIVSAKVLGISEKSIKEVVSSFDGFEGRMNKKFVDNRIIVDNSCSGTKIEDLSFLMKCIGDQEVILIVGEEEDNICESLNYEEVKDKIAEFNFKKIIGIGERYMNLVDECFESYKNGLERAKEISNSKDVLISFVKVRR